MNSASRIMSLPIPVSQFQSPLVMVYDFSSSKGKPQSSGNAVGWLDFSETTEQIPMVKLSATSGAVGLLKVAFSPYR